MRTAARHWPLLSLFALITSVAHGQGTLRFLENKGQWPAEVSYRAEATGATIWCERGAVLIDRFDHPHDPSKGPHGIGAGSVVHHHAVRLRFLSAAPESRTTGERLLKGRYNFFLGNDPKHWAGDVRPFGDVTLRTVAPGCDARFYEGRSGLKYDLLFAPGADPALLRFTYEGADDIALRDGVLVVGTSLGRITERIPIAYQDVQGERRVVSCTYTLKDGVVGIKPGPYDTRLPLVVDPELMFSTFSGSTADNFGYTATFDIAGFLYSGSSAFGQGYPTTTGAYDVTFNGGVGLGPGTDIALTKYDTTGSELIWSTYLGGNGDDLPHSLIVNDADELVMLGTTGSDDFPTTANAYDDSFGGGTPFLPSGIGTEYPNGTDIVVARLSSSGAQLLGSTYIGGTANDGLNSAPALGFNYADEMRGEVLLDANDHVVIVSCTESSDFPVTSGAYRTSYAGGTHDAVVFRLNLALTELEWSTFYGGTGTDAAYSGQIAANGDIIITGGTTSPDLPSEPIDLQPTFHGGQADAFVASLSGDGSTLNARTYFGSSAYDQAYFVELDDAGDVYLLGQTRAPRDSLIHIAGYAQRSGGQMLAKLSPDLTTLHWSSRFGATSGPDTAWPNISPTAFLVDFCDKIYVSGWGSLIESGSHLGTTGLPITADAYQPSTDGRDFYLIVFDIDMSSLVYATYFGGPISREHVDGGTSRFDRRGRVYQSVCAGCGGNSDFPSTPDAWSPTNNSPNCNNGVFKFDFNAPLVIAAFDSPDTICGTNDVTFTNLSYGATSYLWDFGDNSSSIAPAPTHTFPGPGTYTVQLTVFNPLTCNEVDSISRTIQVHPEGPVVQAMNDTLICGPISSFTLRANSQGTADRFIWSTSPFFTDTLNATTADSIAIVAPATSGTYYVRAMNVAPCDARDSVRVTVSLGAIALTGDTAICTHANITLAVQGADPGSTIQWEPEEEIISGQGTATITALPEETMTFAVAVTAPSGCTWEAEQQVLVSPITVSSVTATVDQSLVLAGTLVHLHATPGDGVSYSWTPPEAVSDPTIADPTAVIQRSTTFIVTVSDGICTRSVPVTVQVHELVCAEPDIFVPNTFTPNGDGNNDVLYVRGRSIERMEFQVFDRWGEKVFETSDMARGWDATYNGEAVSAAVFVYHLTAWCVDGQEYFTKGNVTVVR